MDATVKPPPKRSKFATTCLIMILLGFVCVSGIIGYCVMIPEGTPRVEVRDSRVVGDELRAIVETYALSHSFMAHSSKACDVTAYYLVVDLKSNKIVADRSRIYGPLWSVPGERSHLSVSAGVDFTENDRAARKATPPHFFDDSGDLIRLVSMEGSRYRRERLDTIASPHWVESGFQEVLSLKSWPSADYVCTPSGRWHLQKDDDGVRLFDLRTGQVTSDPWLEHVFNEYCAHRVELVEGQSRWLTEDLNHLVAVSSEMKHNPTLADGIIYSRPEYKPRKFLLSSRQVVRLYLLDGEPMLFQCLNGIATLANLDGVVRYRVVLPRDRWFSGQEGHDEDRGQLWFQGGEINSWPASEWHVVTWKYRKNEVNHQEIRLGEIFDLRWNRYRPHKVETIDH